MWHYALGNKSSLLRELIGSSIAKTATGLPIQTGFGEVKIKVNSDRSAKLHQRTINRQETLLPVRDFSVKHEIIALCGNAQQMKKTLEMYLYQKQINSNNTQYFTHKFPSNAANMVIEF